MNHVRSTLVVAAAVLTVAVVIGCLGCGDSSSAPPPAPPSGPTAAPAPGPVAPAGGGAYDPAKATATIRVKAAFKGTAPKLPPIDFSKDEICVGKHKGVQVFPETIVVKDGNLANVIAYVSKGAERWTYKPKTEPQVLDQKGCTYHPHVFTLQTNQPLSVKNSDETMHNIHAVPKVNKNAFNRSQLNEKADVLSEKFDKEEIGLRIKCDVHGWMGAFAGVFSHPFHGVTGEDGTVTIKVPAGEYEVSAWHEYDKLAKPAAQKVTVADGETKDLEFVFEAK